MILAKEDDEILACAFQVGWAPVGGEREVAGDPRGGCNDAVRMAVQMLLSYLVQL